MPKADSSGSVDPEEREERRAFAARLKYAMSRKNMTEAALERAAGLGSWKTMVSEDGTQTPVFKGNGHLNRLLRGERGSPGGALVKKLAVPLGVRPAWLLFDEPPMDSSEAPPVALLPPGPGKEPSSRKTSGVQAKRLKPQKPTGSR